MTYGSAFPHFRHGRRGPLEQAVAGEVPVDVAGKVAAISASEAEVQCQIFPGDGCERRKLDQFSVGSAFGNRWVGCSEHDRKRI